MRFTPSALAALLVASTPLVVASQASHWISPPVELRVPKSPTVAPVSGSGGLANELHLPNWFAQPFAIQAVIAQRFAIDYVCDTAGRTVSGDRANNANPYAQNVEALAVADGIVVATKDSIRENVPGPRSRAVPITLETIGGNFVILDIGNGRYAFYAHLRPGSLRVRVGDRVRRGQVIGLGGNSGDSTEPRLHFHLADANSPLGAEGIPYVDDSFEVLGRCTETLTGCTRNARPERQRGEMPVATMIIRFPQ